MTAEPSAPQPGGDVEQVAPGVWSIRVPVPFAFGPPGGTLVHLIETARGPVLVDTGWDTPEGWRALTDGIAATGHDVADCHGVAVTHFHPDHHGLSGRVREASGAWIAMHAVEARTVATQRAEGLGGLTGIAEAYLSAGAPDSSYADIGPGLPLDVPPPAEADRLLADGDLLDVPGHRLRALWTPGHTAGHLSFHLENRRLLMTGDHILPRISPHIGLWMQSDDADPLGDFLASLERLAELDVDEVLPAHEYRFRGLSARISFLLAHHAQRLRAIEDRLAAGAATMWEITEAMPWDVAFADVPAMMRHIALGEARAHVRHLVRLGRVRRVDSDGAARYTLVRAA